MTPQRFPRRTFLGRTAAGVAAVSAGGVLLPSVRAQDPPAAPAPYRGPNVVLIRYGGGARRRESIDPVHSHSPFLRHELIRRGTLFPRMEIDQIQGLQTSHGEGTLNLLTGKYDTYRDVGETRPDIGRRFLAARFEAKVPTVFEYLRATHAVPDHQALIINGEDRGDEEFYNFSNHHLFGVRHRSQTLSLRRYKMWLLRRQLEEGSIPSAEIGRRRKELAEMEALDYRVDRETGQGEVIDGFWERWRERYGVDGLRNPRGDRLLTHLAVQALRELRPRLLMVNYQDCDYVHWGHLSHYTNGIRVMDEGIEQIHRAVEADPVLRLNTVLVVVPDCGRDDNPFLDVPCQHHFGSRASHEIFALVVGPGIPAGKVVDRRVSQVDIAPTIGRLMGFATPHAEGSVLTEVFG